MKKIIFLLLTAMIFISCDEEPIDNYKGDIISYKGIAVNKKKFLILKRYYSKQNRYFFQKVYVLPSDFEKYNINDTIK